MEIISELIHSAMGSTERGFIGVGLIFIYFTIIVSTAVYRIGQNLKHDHH